MTAKPGNQHAKPRPPFRMRLPCWVIAGLCKHRLVGVQAVPCFGKQQRFEVVTLVTDTPTSGNRIPFFTLSKLVRWCWFTCK
eukprot:g42617.t1